MRASTHLNPQALTTLCQGLVDAAIESGGRVPDDHPLMVETRELTAPCQERVDYFMCGADYATGRVEGTARAALERGSMMETQARATVEAEGRMAAIRLGVLEAERIGWEARALEAERANARYLLGETMMVWGGAILLGVGCAAGVIVAVLAIAGRLGR